MATEEEPEEVEPKSNPPTEITISPGEDPLEHVKKIEPIKVKGKTDRTFDGSAKKGTVNSGA